MSATALHTYALRFNYSGTGVGAVLIIVNVRGFAGKRIYKNINIKRSANCYHHCINVKLS